MNALQTGTDVKNAYFSEHHRLADKILALHGMAESILRIVSTLRDAMMRCHIRTEAYENNKTKTSINEKIDKKRAGVLAGMTAGRFSLASMEIGSLAATSEAGLLNAQFLSRTGSNLMKTARVARVAGGALSAATLVFEARCMTKTINEIKDGNPCDKAQRLRQIKLELDENKFPTTHKLDSEIENYLSALAYRDRALTQDEVVQILLEQMEDEGTMEEGATPVVSEDLELVLEGDDGAEGGADENQNVPPSATVVGTAQVSSSCSSLPSHHASLLERIESYKQTTTTTTTAAGISNTQHHEASAAAFPSSSSSSTFATTASNTDFNHNNKPSLLERIAKHKQLGQQHHTEASLTL